MSDTRTLSGSDHALDRRKHARSLANAHGIGACAGDPAMTTSATDTEPETRSAPSSARRTLFSLLCAIAMRGRRHRPAAATTAAASTADDGGGGSPDASASDDGGDDGADGADDGDGAGGDGADDGGEADCPLGQPQDPIRSDRVLRGVRAGPLRARRPARPAGDRAAGGVRGRRQLLRARRLDRGRHRAGGLRLAVAGPGVCLSHCIPLVAENAGLLPQDICPTASCARRATSRAASPTGACELDLSCERRRATRPARTRRRRPAPAIRPRPAATDRGICMSGRHRAGRGARTAASRTPAARRASCARRPS